jgi:hypothetical protein
LQRSRPAFDGRLDVEIEAKFEIVATRRRPGGMRDSIATTRLVANCRSKLR